MNSGFILTIPELVIFGTMKHKMVLVSFILFLLSLNEGCLKLLFLLKKSGGF